VRIRWIDMEHSSRLIADPAISRTGKTITHLYEATDKSWFWAGKDIPEGVKRKWPTRKSAKSAVVAHLLAEYRAIVCALEDLGL
jgi:hypothetical protein